VAGVSLAGLTRGEAAAKLTGVTAAQCFRRAISDNLNGTPAERAVRVVRSHLRHEFHARTRHSVRCRAEPDPADQEQLRVPINGVDVDPQVTWNGGAREPVARRRVRAGIRSATLSRARRRVTVVTLAKTGLFGRR